MEKVIIIGAGGHAKVVADIIFRCGGTVQGFLDDGIAAGNIILGKPVFGKIADIEKYKNDYSFIVGIGDNKTRERIANGNELRWYTAVHPSAVVAGSVQIGEGSVIMPNAVINVSSKIGKHAIINTGAIVEHDNLIGDYAHISPNAVLGGNVSVGKRTHIGIGAAVKNNIAICPDCIIGVGSVVVKNIEESGTYMGVPAKKRGNERNTNIS